MCMRPATQQYVEMHTNVYIMGDKQSIIMTSKTMFIQQYPKYGYEVRTEMVNNPEEGAEPIQMQNAYTKSGAYIGNKDTAKFLCEIRGIAPELATTELKVCSIGFCEKEQKWYGWSHRAIVGFGIGSEVKRGDCGYVPNTAGDLATEYKEWNEHVEIVDGRTIKVSVGSYKIIGENEDGSLKLSDELEMESYTVKTGRGEWTAKTLEDSRQMAIDFAENVS